MFIVSKALSSRPRVVHVNHCLELFITSKWLYSWPCEIKKGLQNHFATLEQFHKPLCKFQKSHAKILRVTSHLFKPLHTLFSLRTPYLFIAKPSITLQHPNFHRFSLRWMPRAHASEEATLTKPAEHKNEFLIPFMIWCIQKKAILTLHWLGIRHLRPSRLWVFHHLRVEYLLVPLSADMRHGDHRLHPGWLLRALRAQYAGLRLREPGLHTLESHPGLHSLILGPLQSLSYLSTCH